MATNLRLSQQTALALQEAARKTGRSQQDLIRDAVEQYLGIGPVVNERARLIAAGSIKPGTPFEDVEPWVILPAGMSSLALLDRDEDR
jgi:predicted transcriptional regulator